MQGHVIGWQFWAATMSNVKCDVHFSTRSNAKSTQLQNLVGDQTQTYKHLQRYQAVSHKLKFVVTSLLIQMDRHPCRAGRWRPTFPGRVRRRRAPSSGRAAPARRCARCRRSTSGPAVPRSTDPERRSRYRLNGPCKFNVSRSGH